jgi:hypothetical protein
MHGLLRIVGTLTFLLALAPGVSLAVEPTHPELRRFIESGGEVEYLGHALGVDGWLLTKTNAAGKAVVRYAYATPEGGLVLGILLDPQGGVETKKQLTALMRREEGAQASKTPGISAGKTADSGKAEQFYAEVEKAAWARAGSADAPYLYLFINTTCPECQKFWGELQEPVKAGRLQVRLVPFGAIAVNRESGAALLSSEDPGDDWSRFIAGDASVLSKDKVSGDALAKIDANTRLAANWKLQGPPFTLYRRPADGVVTAIVGEPDNLMLVLADLMEEEEAP